MAYALQVRLLLMSVEKAEVLSLKELVVVERHPTLLRKSHTRLQGEEMKRRTALVLVLEDGFADLNAAADFGEVVVS